jgi:two-component system chemotaxis response regulator CheB
MKRLRIVLVDDSAICRVELRRVAETERDIEVVGEASEGSAVLELVQRHAPDLLLVDLQMPGVDGLATVERVMAINPVPILVVTGRPEGRSGDVVFEAIRRGALDLAEKPAMTDKRAQAALRAQIRQLSTVPVVRHMAGGSLSRGFKPAARAQEPVRVPAGRIHVVGIAASAGGPAAVVEMLKEFPKGFPACFAVVQHLPRGFAPAFAEYLATRLRLGVRIAEEGTRVVPGIVMVAPDDRHLVARNTKQFGAEDSPPMDTHRPAATVLFRSLARVFGNNAAGVVLSGIGQDGVAGLREMQQAGALTLAQDEASSAVYGMPRAAAESGAAARSLDPQGLARAVATAVGASLTGSKS